jgi:hypothetical protein
MGEDQAEPAAQQASLDRDELAVQLSAAGQALVQAGSRLLEVERTLTRLLAGLAPPIAENSVATGHAASTPFANGPADSGEQSVESLAAPVEPKPSALEWTSDRRAAPRSKEPLPGLGEVMAEGKGKGTELIEGLADKVDVKEVLARIEERLRRVGDSQDDSS